MCSPIQQLLCEIATLPIEAMDDADELRDASTTADDIADRLRETLAALGAWR